MASRGRARASTPCASYLARMHLSPDDDHDVDDDGAAPIADEQDVVVEFRLSNQSLGRAQERLDLEALGDELGEVLADGDLGEYDGSEVGGGAFTMFFCGPDADKLFAALQPMLKRSPLARGATVIKQYGVDEHGEPKRVTVRL
jgi:hypothetical protein